MLDQEAGAMVDKAEFWITRWEFLVSVFSLFACKDKYRSSFGIPVASSLGKAWHLCTYLWKVVQAPVAVVSSIYR